MTTEQKLTEMRQYRKKNPVGEVGQGNEAIRCTGNDLLHVLMVAMALTGSRISERDRKPATINYFLDFFVGRCLPLTIF